MGNMEVIKRLATVNKASEAIGLSKFATNPEDQKLEDGLAKVMTSGATVVAVIPTMAIMLAGALWTSKPTAMFASIPVAVAGRKRMDVWRALRPCTFWK